MGDESGMIKIGAAGYTYGMLWDEKGHTNIVQIFIFHGAESINSIQFQYAQNGSLVLSKRYGGINGSNFDVVKLNYPTEYITWIRGCNSLSNNNLCSITFGTNHGKYGPFGGLIKSNDKEFCFNLGQDRQFHGFHGTVDSSSIRSIGVYLKPNMNLDISLNKNLVYAP